MTTEVLLMKSGTPEDFDLAEIEKFIKANSNVLGGSLEQRLERCLRLVVLRRTSDYAMVGLSAIKQPFLSYRRKIFKQSTQNIQEFKYEFGYTSIIESYRRRGLANQMVVERLSNFNHNAFATVEITNTTMFNILHKNNFVLDSTYTSELNPSKQMLLMTRKEVEEHGEQIFSGWFPVSKS